MPCDKWCVGKTASVCAVQVCAVLPGIRRRPHAHRDMRRLRTMAGHRARVGVMAWSSHMLSSGSRDRNILQRDIRAPEDFQSKLLGHRSEVHARSS